MHMLSRLFPVFTARGAGRRLNEQGLDLWARGDLPQAERAFRGALRKDGANAAATSNLGSLLMVLHRYDEGMALLQRATELSPGGDAGPWVNLGNAWHFAGRGADAIACLRRALAIDPGHLEANLNILRPLLDDCDWDGIDRQLRFVRERVAAEGSRGWRFVAPFASFFLPFTRAEQLAIARYHAAAQFPEVRAAVPRPWDGRRRIRLGYLSSDFHDHPTMHLARGVFARHDRSRFEVFAYSIGAADSGPYRQQLVRDCDHFAEMHELGDQAIADRIAQDGIDILLDLKGYTGGSRPGILALRPAPVQVNYLGYPGTMGAPFIDWLVADAVLVPPEHADAYAEAILRLPHSYQPTDNLQPVDSAPVDRASVGLPEKAFVYCSFNVAAKFDRDSFAAWMRVLRAVPGSVLWLMEVSPAARAHLAAAARGHDVDPVRIVYADILPKPRHLARLALADLMLDAFVCNAHTTATDALWAGLPLVTRIGQTFASRVAASLLHAVDLPDLAVDSEDAFVELAVRMAQEPGRLAAARAVLAGRAASPLFDTDGYVRALDQALLSLVQPLNSRRP